MRVCKTPGAIYRTEIKAGSVSVTVTLPEKLKGLLDHLLCAQAKSPAQVYEEILHDAMEDAVAKILAHNASRPELICKNGAWRLARTPDDRDEAVTSAVKEGA